MIHEDYVVSLLLHHLDRLSAGAGCVNIHLQWLQQPPRHLEVHLVIVHDQYLCLRRDKVHHIVRLDEGCRSLMIDHLAEIERVQRLIDDRHLFVPHRLPHGILQHTKFRSIGYKILLDPFLEFLIDGFVHKEEINLLPSVLRLIAVHIAQTVTLCHTP